MLPSFTCVGKLVPVSVISVDLADPGLPNEEHTGASGENYCGIAPFTG